MFESTPLAGCDYGEVREPPPDVVVQNMERSSLFERLRPGARRVLTWVVAIAVVAGGLTWWLLRPARPLRLAAFERSVELTCARWLTALGGDGRLNHAIREVRLAPRQSRNGETETIVVTVRAVAWRDRHHVDERFTAALAALPPPDAHSGGWLAIRRAIERAVGTEALLGSTGIERSPRQVTLATEQMTVASATALHGLVDDFPAAASACAPLLPG